MVKHLSRIAISFFIAFAGIYSYAADYYWIGGTGNWSDLTHWATTSGGSTNPTQVPSSADDVYFDDNSFSGTVNEVTVDVPVASCRNFDWRGLTDASFNAEFSHSGATSSLSVYGSFYLSGSMINSFQKEIKFLSPLTGNEIDCDGVTIRRNMIFDNPGGEWSLISPLTMTNQPGINLRQGIFRSGGFAMTVGDIFSTGTLARTLDIQNSDITILRRVAWDTNVPTNLTFLSAGSIIRLAAPLASGTPYMSTTDLVFNDVEFSQANGGGLLLGGNNTFNDLISLGRATVRDNNSFSKIILTAGKSLSIYAGTTLEIREALVSDGTCDAFINISSNSKESPAFLDITPATGSIGVDYTIISNVNVLGGTISATNSLDVLGATTGWAYSAITSRTLYFVGGLNSSNSWSDPANWSTTSGTLVTNACPPSPLDDVVFDGGSFTATMNECNIDLSNAVCRNMTWSGVTNTPNFRNTLSGSSLSIYGSLEFDTDMTTELQRGTNFVGAGSFTVQPNGQKFSNSVSFSNPNGEWNLLGDLYIEQPGDGVNQGQGGNLTLRNGILRTNGHAIRCVTFNSGVDEPRELHLGSSYVTLVGRNIGNGSHTWHVGFVTNFTFDPGTSTIEFTRSGQSLGIYFTPGTPFHNILFSDSDGSMTLYGNNTFNEVTLLGDAQIGRTSGAGTNIYNVLNLSAGKEYAFVQGRTQKIATLNAVGSCTERILLRSILAGSEAAFEPFPAGGTISGDGLVIMDIRGQNGTLIGANSAEVGTTSGWTITTTAGVGFYWIGGDGNWSDTNNWSLTSGGPPSGCLPGPNDDVYFDNNSFSGAGQTVTQDLSIAYCRNMDWTGATGTPNFNGGGAGNSLRIFGGVTFIADMAVVTPGSPFWYFDATSGSHDVICAGHSFPRAKFIGPGGTWNFQDHFRAVQMFHENGTINSLNNPITSSIYYSFVAATPTLNLGSSLMTITGNATANNSSTTWRTNSTLILNEGTSTIRFTGNSLPTLLDVGNHTFHNMEFTSGTGVARIYGTHTFNSVTMDGSGQVFLGNTYETLNLAAGKIYQFSVGNTQTITATGSMNATGNPSAQIEIKSFTAGAQANFLKEEGIICLNYVQMQDINGETSSGAFYFAGANSDNISNNTAWAFTFCEPQIINSELCDTVIFDESGFSIGAWAWDFGDPASGAANTSTVANPAHVFSDVGTYTVYVDIDLLTTTNRVYFTVNVAPDSDGSCDTVLVESEVPAIPTLSEWGLILFGLLLMCIGAAVVWRKKYAVKRTNKLYF